MIKIPGWMAPLVITTGVSLLGAIVPSPAGAACGEVDPLLALPSDDTCPGWSRSGETRTAYSIEELTEIIDGAAYLYGQYGFVAAAFQNYAGEVGGNPTEITLSAFNQGTAENAEALYNDPDSGSGDPVDGWAGSGQARMRIAFGFVSFQFWEGCFFVSIVAASGGEDALAHVRCLADETASLIQGATPGARETWGDIKAVFR